MTRRALLGVALACAAFLAFELTRAGQDFQQPTQIVWRFGIPLILGVSSLAFAVLRVNGRIALASVLGTLVLLEAGFGLVNAVERPHEQVQLAADYYRSDPRLGWAPTPGVTTRARKRVDGQTIYDVTYAIDQKGRRITPVDPPGGRTQFALFFGGSCTFGEGLEQTQTLPYFVGQRAPHVMPYNYGFHGYGPQHMLARLESGSLRGEVAERSGMAVYLFIDSHVNRAIGSMVVYTGWAHSAPYYVPNAAGVPVRHGNLSTGRPLVALAYSLLGESQILRYFRVEIPPVISDEHVEWTARILARSATLFHQQFGPGRFVVVMFPGSKLAGRLGAALHRLGVETLDYSGLLDYDRPEFHLPYDWHPTAATDRAIATQLVADLGIGAAPRPAGP